MGKILQLLSHESQMIRALREQDPKAQRMLFEKYSGRMLTVCVRYVGDRMAAEDVLVQGFMKIFDAIHQFREEGSFEGWMRRIMVNEALAYLRRQRKFIENADLAEAQAIPDYQYADANLQTKEILEMIEKLPPGYRTVFNLYAIEGYAHIEIAEMLGITESTSKSQLHRARACLKEMVGKWEAESRSGTNLNNSQSQSV